MPTRRDDAPLIVTALLGAACFDILDGLRRRHFPAHLNKIPAHISLFHALPGDAVEQVVDEVTRLCRARRAFDLAPLGLRFLGRGVAIFYEAGDLAPLHATLARGWADWLTPQDHQAFKPHVTIQNKVHPDEARALLEDLARQEMPACRIEGLQVWRYRGGPWEAVADCPFADQTASARG